MPKWVSYGIGVNVIVVRSVGIGLGAFSGGPWSSCVDHEMLIIYCKFLALSELEWSWECYLNDSCPCTVGVRIDCPDVLGHYGIGYGIGFDNVVTNSSPTDVRESLEGRVSEIVGRGCGSGFGHHGMGLRNRFGDVVADSSSTGVWVEFVRLGVGIDCPDIQGHH